MWNWRTQINQNTATTHLPSSEKPNRLYYAGKKNHAMDTILGGAPIRFLLNIVQAAPKLLFIDNLVKFLWYRPIQMSKSVYRNLTPSEDISEFFWFISPKFINIKSRNRGLGIRVREVLTDIKYVLNFNLLCSCS